MNLENPLDKSIKAALEQKAQEVEIGTDSLKKIKSRLQMDKERIGFDMKNLFMRKSVAVLCSIAAVALIMGVYQPARVWAQEGVSKAVEMIYIVVKGDDGKYKTEQLAADEVKVATTAVVSQEESMSDEEIAKEFGSDVKTPVTLKGGFNLDSQTVLNLSGLDGKSTISQVTKWYSNKDQNLFLEIAYEDYALIYNREQADNRKVIKVGEKTVYYGESALPIYPIIETEVNGETVRKNDITQKPEKIQIIHQFAWEHNGVYYSLQDLKTEVPYDTLKNALDSIIESLK
ncbi:hypothetical protein [Petroclostridium sp. X23]|uniref:hypothetical protein n=1 Tax=Petroclostridium sp. X23 TaxID=3045146 RepID=UPI0024AC8393|nr:hypothetical protein [Petroclostridium sp. X23]WHH57267.1 hypothetical protein QKW49_15670 [Petroclostridium sp. X23]